METRKLLIALPLLAALSAHAQVAEPVDSIYQKDGWESPDGVPPVTTGHKWEYGEKDFVREGEETPGKVRSLSAKAKGIAWMSAGLTYGKNNVSHGPDNIQSVMFDYTLGYKLFDSAPLFLQTSAGLGYSWYSTETKRGGGVFTEYWDFDERMLSLSFSVELLCRISFGRGHFAVEPFVGFCPVWYFLTDCDAADATVKDAFDKDAFEYLERVSIRGKGGINLCYDDFFVGVALLGDINKFQHPDGGRSRVWEVSLGYRF